MSNRLCVCLRAEKEVGGSVSRVGQDAKHRGLSGSRDAKEIYSLHSLIPY